MSILVFIIYSMGSLKSWLTKGFWNDLSDSNNIEWH